MDDLKPKPPYAFMDALSSLHLLSKQWMPTALWLIVAHFALNLMSIQPDLRLAMYTTVHPALTKADIPEFSNILAPSLLAASPRVLLEFVTLYIFCSFFWQNEPLSKVASASPAMSMARFGDFIWRFIQVSLLVDVFSFLPALVFLAPAVILRQAIPHGILLSLVLLCLTLVAVAIAMTYWSCRYMFVLPLTVHQVKQPFRQSLALSYKKAWRIFIQAVTGGIVFLLPVVIGIIVATQIAGVFIPGSMSRILVEIPTRLWVSSLVIGQDACMAAFMCAMTRHFYQEKTTLDPRFALSFPPNQQG